MLLFVYGAFAPSDLAERVGFSGEGHPAFIENVTREIRKPGVMTLQKSPASQVLGYAVNIEQSEIDALKDWEVPREFKTENVIVNVDFGHGFVTRPGVTFVSKSKQSDQASPSYIKRVSEVVREFWSESAKKPNPTARLRKKKKVRRTSFDEIFEGRRKKKLKLK